MNTTELVLRVIRTYPENPEDGMTISELFRTTEISSHELLQALITLRQEGRIERLGRPGISEKFYREANL